MYVNLMPILLKQKGKKLILLKKNLLSAGVALTVVRKIEQGKKISVCQKVNQVLDVWG